MILHIPLSPNPPKMTSTAFLTIMFVSFFLEQEPNEESLRRPIVSRNFKFVISFFSWKLTIKIDFHSCIDNF